MARCPGVALWRRIVGSPDAGISLVLWALAFLPMLWTSPGRVSADTKTYLTLGPGRLLTRATSMWDPSVGAGTVPHQNIGYVFPLGPYYWVLETAGVPDWLAQRLLWALLVFAASYGTHRLLRWLGWEPAAALIGAVAYGFSPYLLSYLARLSAIAFPWAALPWMILLAAQAARDRSWRTAAQFAFVVALVGSVNATSLLFVGLGPILWLVTDALSRRERLSTILAASARIGVLSAGVSAWWIAGLRVQSTYGLPILDFTETYDTVASSSTPPEILRGLGYWFFYGGDFLDPWVGPAAAYFNDPLVMFISFGLTGCALLGLLVPFRGRASMLLLFGVGLTLSVGAAPLGDSTWYGAWYRQFAIETTAGAALRSTPRAAPLLLLALAAGLGAGATALQRRLASMSPGVFRRLAPAVPFGTVAIVLVNLLPWFTGNVASSALLRPEQLPAATTALAAYLNDPSSPSGRIYAIPGSDFADYRWGGTVDPVLPGLTDRSVLYRELIPQGSPGTADLLNAFERRLSEGWFEPATLPEVAELFAIDTVVVRNDLQYERYRLARPGPLWTAVTSVFGEPDYAGPTTTDSTRVALIDEITLARDDAADQFPINAAFEVGTGADLLVRDAATPMIVAGNGDGLVDLAGAGLLDTSRALLYAADLDAASVDAAESPWWVVTDTNRKQGRRWSSLGFNFGALEPAGPLETDDDARNRRLDLFDDELDDQTIALHLGDFASVTASSYGSSIIYTAEDAPYFATDGDSTTAWRGAIAESSSSLSWTGEFVEPELIEHLVLLQPQVGANDRFITRARITTDSGSFVVDLDDSSRFEPGQVVTFGEAGELTTSVTVEVLADNLGDLASFAGQPGVGFAEVTPVRPDGTPVLDDRVVRVPVASDQRIGPDDRLSYVFTRQRLDPATPNRQAPELELDRQFDVPSARSFDFTGQARLAGNVDDALLADLLAGEGADLRAVASARLSGSVSSGGFAAVDGDASTAWQTPFDGAEGAVLTITRPTSDSFTSLTISWRDDAEHAMPTEVTLVDGNGQTAVVPLEADPLADGVPEGVATATVAVPSWSGDTLTLTLSDVSDDVVPEYFSSVLRRLPVAIAEVSIGTDDAGQSAPASPSIVDTGCRSDLVEVDGRPVSVSISGEFDSVLDVVGCGAPLDLGAGEHRMTVAPGRLTGLDLDRVVLDDRHAEASVPAIESPVSVTSLDTTSIDARIDATRSATWLVLPQSHNDGWTLAVGGDDFGAPQLINGYANGWLIPAGADDRAIELRWTPQGSVDISLLVSAGFGLSLLAIIGFTTWRRRPAAVPLGVASADDRVGRPLPRSARQVAWIALAATFLVVGGPVAAGTSLVVGGLSLWERQRRDAHWVAVGIACVGWAAVSGGIIALEWRFDYADGPDWPLRFTWASTVTWTVVAAIVTAASQAVLTVCSRRPAATPSTDSVSTYG